MGARRLRAWLMRPLTALERIQDRLDAVEEFAFKATERGRLRDTLRAVHDLERLVGRVAHRHGRPARPGRAAPVARRDPARPPGARADGRRRSSAAWSASSTTSPTSATRWPSALVEEPPALARDGGVIRDGVDPELDALRDISRSGREHIAAMEEAERARTGISSLKIRYNRVFGYYIEITKTNLGRVPADYHRKQTLAGGERFITPGAEGLRGEGARRRRADPRARAGDLRGAAAPRSPRRRRASRSRRGRWRRSTCSPRSARWRRCTTTPSR